MAIYSSDKYTANAPMPYHGDATDAQHLHCTVTTTAALTTADTFNFGYLPNNAVVVGAVLKAATQLDSNGSPTLTINVGIPGTAALFYSASTVGRSAGASVDVAPAAGGRLYKNTTGAKVLVNGAVAGNAATGAAGSLELALTYFIEE